MRLLIFIILTLIAVQTNAGIYYVATNGNDSWDGTSPAYVSGTTGPWLTVGHIYSGGGCLLTSGDTLYIRGGVYSHTDDSLGTGLTVVYAQATSNSPIVISNYPSETPIVYGSGANNNAMLLRHSCWVRIYGIIFTNAYRCGSVDTSTNCEIANCSFYGTTNSYAGAQAALGSFVGSGGMTHCWIHNDTFSSLGAMTNSDQGNNVTIGNFNATLGSPDWTCFNIIESNYFGFGGHASFADYGQTNLIQDNFGQNTPWYYRYDDRQLVGHRVMEQGGAMGMGSWIQYNRWQFAGVTENGGAHGIEMDGPGTSVARFNSLLNCDGTGLVIYGQKVGSPMVASWGTNYVYGNTIAWNGYGQRYVTNYTTTNVIDNGLWLRPLATVNTTNNIFVNNLFFDNYQPDLFFYNNPAVGVGTWSGNMTNYSSGTMFVNTNNGGNLSQTMPDINLVSNAPAVDAGVFLTTITSASSSGTSFDVADARYFFTGMTACYRTVPGDTIQLQGSTNTAVITGISGNTITVNSSLTWTNGQGVSLPYSGTAPDAGAFEYAGTGGGGGSGGSTTMGTGGLLQFLMQ